MGVQALLNALTVNAKRAVELLALRVLPSAPMPSSSRTHFVGGLNGLA